jgi:hypothetical protein
MKTPISTMNMFYGKGPPDQSPESGPAHELEEFVQQNSNQLSSEYTRIRRRAREDPGTAGDEGEENWRELLEKWLPPQFPIVTKGRILGGDGRMSPQVDVLILHPGYPTSLQSKKVYMAGGVVAAFECKLTLKPAHVREAAATARIVRALVPPRTGSLFDELHSPVIFGLLAHRTSLNRNGATRIDQILAGELALDSHPKDALDVVCVANLACWKSWTTVLLRGHLDEKMWATTREVHDLDIQGSIRQHYARWVAIDWRGPDAPPNPLYVLIGQLLHRLAWEFATYQTLARYWHDAQVTGASGAAVASRSWPLTTLSDGAKGRIEAGGLVSGDLWNRWGYSD